MGFLKSPKILLMIICFFFSTSCAKNFNPVVSAPPPLEKEKVLANSFLEGSFVLENGFIQSLADLSDRPILIFFVGEFCGDCIDETTELKGLVRKNGMPGRLHLVTVMTVEGPGVIGDWFAAMEPQDQPAWILGSDQNLELFYRYFPTYRTPSVLYFDPTTKKLKLWYQPDANSPKTSLQQILDEVQPWN